jgi:hypothetical protein
MDERELRALARALFRSCAENARAWREIGVMAQDPENLRRAPGWEAWRRRLGLAPYESALRAMRSAEAHLNDLGYQTTAITSHTKDAVSVRVAEAVSVRLCVRVPKGIAPRIAILGIVPRLPPAAK